MAGLWQLFSLAYQTAQGEKTWAEALTLIAERRFYLYNVFFYQSKGWERLMTAPGHVIARGLLPGEALFPAAAATPWGGILDRFSVYPKV